MPSRPDKLQSQEDVLRFAGAVGLHVVSVMRTLLAATLLALAGGAAAYLKQANGTPDCNGVK
ncbi:hypothetical protein [Duganella violaceipulchra]|uniref:Uncharacterized protein n=1 Tax=Duganella violaceipulchra TaxID=2849652 RepID=A0AA41LAM6_9BURK|nr:hypothetical protein [Duganella violaceicalia]MBV6324430.1 hypothetical protein [Duganella violaceicalia]MCP2012034.1 hypothetical protein [Duganella violaceicalia]